MKALFLALIRLYQLTIAPFLGQTCRFYPTCSEYARGAIQKYGCLKGTWLTLKRLAKCNPWHQGGVDEV